ncbi:Rrf2 family transcriptional regulator [Enterococcus sp. LJL99]
MKYSKATDYALHTMVLLGERNAEPPISVIELAETQNLSPTYLSKILTKLAKEGLVKAISGAHGGYSIRDDWKTISFFDIIQAIEGKQSIFECYVHDNPKCVVKNTMFQAEEIMEQFLKNQYLDEAVQQKKAAFGSFQQ